MGSEAQRPLSREAAEAVSLGMPKCPNCNGPNVRLSHPIGLKDTLLGMARYYPYRCRVCQHRFYKRAASGARPPNPWAKDGA